MSFYKNNKMFESMKKKMMKLVVKLSMKTGLLRMKFKLFKYNLRNRLNIFTRASFSKAVVTSEEE